MIVLDLCYGKIIFNVKIECLVCKEVFNYICRVSDGGSVENRWKGVYSGF